MSLCLIAYVILPLVTLNPACRPAVYSVLVTLLRLCCLFVPLSTSLTLWFDSFTLSQQAHFQTLSSITSLYNSLDPILNLHLACFHPIISAVFFFKSKLAVHHTPQFPAPEACEGAHWRPARDTWLVNVPEAGGGLQLRVKALVRYKQSHMTGQTTAVNSSSKNQIQHSHSGKHKVFVVLWLTPAQNFRVQVEVYVLCNPVGMSLNTLPLWSTWWPADLLLPSSQTEWANKRDACLCCINDDDTQLSSAIEGSILDSSP